MPTSTVACPCWPVTCGHTIEDPDMAPRTRPPEARPEPDSRLRDVLFCPVRMVGRKDLLTSAFDFALPDELIAQEPAEPRDRSRLMVVRRREACWEHRTFGELPELLAPGD